MYVLKALWDTYNKTVLTFKSFCFVFLHRNLMRFVLVVSSWTLSTCLRDIRQTALDTTHLLGSYASPDPRRSWAYNEVQNEEQSFSVCKTLQQSRAGFCPGGGSIVFFFKAICLSSWQLIFMNKTKYFQIKSILMEQANRKANKNLKSVLKACPREFVFLILKTIQIQVLTFQAMLLMKDFHIKWV